MSANLGGNHSIREGGSSGTPHRAAHHRSGEVSSPNLHVEAKSCGGLDIPEPRPIVWHTTEVPSFQAKTQPNVLGPVSVLAVSRGVPSGPVLFVSSQGIQAVTGSVARTARLRLSSLARTTLSAACFQIFGQGALLLP